MKKETIKKHSRRDFLKKTALAGSLLILPRHILGGVGYTAPSDRLVLAGIGVGGKGRTDILRAADGNKNYVVALCDVDSYGEHGVRATRQDFPEARFYEDYRILLDKEKDIDAVTISTPDHTHAVIAMDAMQRGKHVYVQKPLTHNIQEARLLTETAQKQKIVTQMGNQGASSPDVAQIHEWFNKGLIGNVTEIQVWTNRPVWPQGIAMPKPQPNLKPRNLNWNLWLGPAKETPYIPNIHPFNWRGWWQYGTGALGDMGCHLIDIPYRVLGLHYPQNVECSLGTIYTQMWVPDYHPEGAPASSMVTIHYDATAKNPSPIKMVWRDGGIRPAHPNIIPPEDYLGEKGSGNGVMMIGTKGIITCGTYGLNPKLYRKGYPTLFFTTPENPEPEFGHQRKWIEACKAGYGSQEHKALTSSFDYAGPLTESILMGNLAIRSYMLRKKNNDGYYDYYGQKKLLWNGDTMTITNLQDANQFVGRTYRKGWEI